MAEQSANVVFTADISAYEQNISRAEQATNSLLTGVVRLTEQLSRLSQSSGRSLQLVGAGTVAGLTGATASAGRLQQQMQSLDATAALSGRSLGQQSRMVNQLRGDYAGSTEEVVSLVEQLTNLGQTNRGVESMTKEFVKLGAATGESVPELVEGMVELQKQMGNQGQENTRRYVSELANLSATAGTSATSILAFSNALAPTAELSRMSQTDLMGFSTAFSSIGNEGTKTADVFNTMVSDLTRSMSSGGPQLKAYANLLGVTAEELTKMPTADAVTGIFDAITKQGPNAIRTMERLGLGGPEQYQALARLQAEGGVRQHLHTASEGGTEEGMSEFARISEKALSGLNNEISQLGTNVQRIVQALGSGFLPMLEKVASVAATVTGGIASLTEGLGRIPGLATGMGAAGMIAGGTMLRSVPMAMAAGGVAMAGRSTFAAGIRDARGSQTPWVGRVAQRYDSRDPQMGAVQRGGFMLGRGLGAATRRPSDGEGQRVGLGRQAWGGISRGIGMGVQGIGFLARAQLDPLRPSNLMDPTNREQMTRGWRMPGAAQVYSRGAEAFTRGTEGIRASRERLGGGFAMFGARSGAQGAAGTEPRGGGARAMFAAGGRAGDQGMSRLSTAATQARNSLSQMTQSATRYRTASGAVVGELGRFSVALARAGAGMGMVGGGMALRGAGAAAGGLGRLASGAMGLVGGGVGAAAIGGLGLYTQWKSGRDRYDEWGDRPTESNDQAYREALGLAAEATRTFADVVNESSNSIRGEDHAGGSPTKLSDSDIRAASDPSMEYTNPDIATMSEDEARVYASNVLGGLTPEGQNLVKLDLQKRFADSALVEDIMTQASAEGPMISELSGDLDRDSGWRKFWEGATPWRIGASDATLERSSELAQAARETVSRAPDDSREAATLYSLEEMLAGIIPQGTHGREAGAMALADFLGVSDDREQVNKVRSSLDQVFSAHRGGGLTDPADQLDMFITGLEAEDTFAGRELARLREVAQGQSFQGADVSAEALARDPWSYWGLGDGTIERIQRTGIGERLLPTGELGVQDTHDILSGQSRGDSFVGPISPDYQRGIAGSEYTTDVINRALTSQADNQSFQQYAAWQWAGNTQAAAGGDIGRTLDELDAFRKAVGDATHPLHQLATAAMSAAQQRHAQEELPYMSREERVEYAAGNLERSRAAVIADPEDQTAMEDFQRDRDAFFSAQHDAHQRNLQVAYAAREMEVSKERATEDFERQRGYSDEDFERGRGRQLEEFERGQGRQEASRQRSEARAFRDFDIGQARQEEDYTLSRQRQDESFERGRARATRDFNISRGRQEHDFNLQRTRQDEAYTRQRSRAVRDFNISRERSEFDFNLQRGRQDEDYHRQLTRSWRDFNISRERGEYEFNLQRERQQEDFNRSVFRAQRDYDKQRGRAQDDFDLNRQRQEEDFNHQMVVMAQRSARELYNIFERVGVQRTLSGQNIVANMADQERRTKEQLANLERAREMGLGDDAIRLLGLNEAGNSQQLARLIQDMVNDPSVVAELNKLSESRNTLAGELITDEANLQWEEMRRSYNLQVERSVEDFQKGMQRQAEDFAQSMSDMREDFNRSMTRAGTDFARHRRQQHEDFVRGLNDQRVEYQISLQRSEEDYHRARRRQLEDFNRSMNDQRIEYNIQVQQAADDYHRARRRALDDFTRSMNDQRIEYNIQIQQSEEDFNRARARQRADFNRSINDQRVEYWIMVQQQRVDFARQRAYQQEDYNRSVQRMTEEFNRSQRRMQEDFNRNATEITGSFSDIAAIANEALTGIARMQSEKVTEILDQTSTDVTTSADELVKEVNKVMDNLGLAPMFSSFFDSNSSGSGNRSSRGGTFAEGGTIHGESAHEAEDNIPIWATAGEFMQPVKSVKYYGKETMERMRRREIPKEAFEGYATGGLIGRTRKQSVINFGHYLQNRGYSVREHPLFGGVHPTAHLPTSRGGKHYIGEAIDVTYPSGNNAKMLDAIIRTAEQIGLGYIWRSAGHYGHAHFDTATRRRLNGVTSWQGGAMAGGVGALTATDSDGNVYDKEFFDELKKGVKMKKWEKTLKDNPMTKKRYMADSVAKALSIQAITNIPEYDDLSGAPDGPQGTGVERWRSLVVRALRHVGQPVGHAGITLRRMNQESSGNPRAINLWDVNAKNGVPSKGLMQVIDPTFRAYRDKNLINDIWDPFANVVSSMRYALSRYGSLPSAYNRRGGYANGGEITWHGDGGIFTSPRRVGVAERGPEAIIPLNKQGAEFFKNIAGPDEYRTAHVASNSVPTEYKTVYQNYSYDHSTRIEGEITVQAQDPEAMMRKIDAKKRMDALIGRKR